MLSRREYERMPWELRSAVKFASTELFREKMRECERRDREAAIVVISSGTNHQPENWFLAPILSVLRRGGWVGDESRLLLFRSSERDSTEITLEYGD